MPPAAECHAGCRHSRKTDPRFHQRRRRLRCGARTRHASTATSSSLPSIRTSPYAPRVAAMVAVRREEIIWRRCVLADTPPAYWSYLRRYPDGPHVWDARRRLAHARRGRRAAARFRVLRFRRAASAAGRTRSIFMSRFSCSSGRASRHHRRRRCFSCRRGHANSRSCRHHRHRMNVLVCRFRPRPWFPHS